MELRFLQTFYLNKMIHFCENHKISFMVWRDEITNKPTELSIFCTYDVFDKLLKDNIYIKRSNHILVNVGMDNLRFELTN